MSFVVEAKAGIQKVLRRFGWEIRRFHLTDMDRLTHYLRQHDVEVVLDIGANIGQFATTLRQSGYAGEIISFEPQSQAFRKLAAAAASDPRWTIAPRTAIGNANGEIEINISENTVSSSVLGIMPTHVEGAPSSAYVGKETVPLVRLDDCAAIPSDKKIYLKIDTQGFEGAVLDGAPELLARVCGLELELSLVPLYDGQTDALELLNRVTALGFDIWAINSEFQDPRSARMLQVNAVFFRRAQP